MEPSEQEKENLLQSYREITNVPEDEDSPRSARRMLENHRWNLESAINAFMVGDFNPPARSPPPVPSGASLYGGPTEAPHSQQQPGDFSLPGARPDGQYTTPMDGAPLAPGSGILSFPLRLAESLLSTILAPLDYLIGATPPPSNPDEAAERFIADFNREYAEPTGRMPPFLPSRWAGACAAAFGGRRLLLVYLHAPLHEDAPAFARDVLCSEALGRALGGAAAGGAGGGGGEGEGGGGGGGGGGSGGGGGDGAAVAAAAGRVAAAARGAPLLWGASVAHPEGYRAADVLGATRYPFLALLLPKSGNKVELVDRFEGPLGAGELADKLAAAQARHAAGLAEEAGRAAARAAEAALRQEQDAEFRAALEADRQAAAARAAAQEAEAEGRRRAEMAAALELSRKMTKEAELKRKRDALPPEPPAGPGATRLRLQLPHGAKVDRRFDADAPLRVVGDFIDVHFADNEIEIENYSVSTNFPKRTFAELGAETLRAAGLHPQAVLFVQDLDA